MPKDKFLRAIEEIIEADSGTLQGGEALADLSGWDSMAVLSFLAMADSECGIAVPPKSVAESKTLEDLYKLLQPVG